MAVTSTSSISLNIADSSTGLSGNFSASLTETLSGTDWLVQPQTATTSWAALNIGFCASADLLAVRNLDAANFVQLSLDNTGTKIFAKLKGISGGGRFCFIPIDPTATIYIKADTASCQCLVAVREP